MLPPLCGWCAQDSGARLIISVALCAFCVCDSKGNVCTSVSNLYVCVCMCVQVILISSTINEQDQMLFISTDEGASFQRQPLSFTVETLLFHPSDEDKLLAYSKEAMVRCCCANVLRLQITSANLCMGYGIKSGVCCG